MALPALVQAQQYQSRAGHVGFEWPKIQDVLDKLEEELGEFHAAEDSEQRFAEMGDVLFAAVNLARWHKVDAESALRETNMRFRKRFGFIEAAARGQGKSVADFSIEEMLELWKQAKH